jgi:hypothetical protein
MFGLSGTSILLILLAVLVYSIDKLVTWRITNRAVDAAERQVPLGGIAELFEGFSKLPVVGATYEAGMGELRRKAAATPTTIDDDAVEWLDARGRKWLRVDVLPADDPVAQAVERDPAVERVKES